LYSTNNQISTSTTTTATSSKATAMNSINHDAQALRYLSLLIASKFSTTNWNYYDTIDHDNDNEHYNDYHEVLLSIDDNNNEVNEYCPIIVYYNTVQQALLASQQLQRLKLIEQYKTKSNMKNYHQEQLQQNEIKTIYDTITILSLQDTLPIHILNDNDKKLKKKMLKQQKKSLINKNNIAKSSNVNPSKGIIIIVQPTDYNNNYEHHDQQTQSQSTLRTPTILKKNKKKQ
jgi:hypothetical protein